MDSSTQSIFDTIDAIKKIETLSDTEKSENIKKANELLRHIIKDRQCNKCKNVCNNINACEFCIQKYLVGRFEKWTSEHEEIDDWIESCQKSTLRPDYIIEWIPYSNLQDIQYQTEGGIYHKMKALWVEGRYTSWDVKRQELKRFGPHYVTIKNVSINNPNEEQSLQEIKAHLTLTSTMSPVIRIYGLTKDGNNDYMIITENVAYNLKSYLQENISMLTWIQKYRILQDILESLGSIHNNNFVHGDLHSGIVRYSINREIWLIGDLRFCSPIDKPLKSFGTVQYIAPEVLKKEGHMTTDSDIYSFAMIMWEVSTGRQPFDGEKQLKLSEDIINGMRPDIMYGTPSRYSELMKKCWNDEPSKRPSLVDVQNEIKEVIDNYYKGSQEEQKDMMSIDYLKSQFVHTNKFGVKPNIGKDNSIEIINYDHISQEYSDRVDKISFATMSSKRVALKTLQIDKSDKTNEKKGTLLIEILQKHISELSHIYNSTNIVGFLGIGIKDESKLFFVMPLANHGNLRKYIKDNKLSFREKIKVAKGITIGIKILHDNKIVHGNINPTNVLIFDGIAKISNLPLPLENKEFKDNKDLYINDDLFDNIGYIDPNSFLKGYNGSYKKNVSADIYSLGTLLWEIMSERVPYQDDGILQLIKKIKVGYREVDIPHIPEEYKNLYTKCWHEDILVRPTIEDVNEQLKHLI